MKLETKNCSLPRIIKIQILKIKIEELCGIYKESNYVEYYQRKLIKMYINSGYDEGIYKIIIKYRLLYYIYDINYIIELINYYKESKYKDVTLRIILDDSISMGNKMVILRKEFRDITVREYLENGHSREELKYLLKINNITKINLSTKFYGYE